MASPQQAMLMVRSAGAGSVNLLPEYQVWSFVFPGDTAVATLLTSQDGNVYTIWGEDGVNPAQLQNQWLLSGDPEDYEFRVTMSLGSLDHGTVDTWLAGNVLNSWGITISYGGKSCTFLLEVRDADTLTVLDSASVMLTVEST